MIAGIDFVEAGERKLRTCVDEIIKFGDSGNEFPHQRLVRKRKESMSLQ